MVRISPGEQPLMQDLMPLKLFCRDRSPEALHRIVKAGYRCPASSDISV